MQRTACLVQHGLIGLFGTLLVHERGQPFRPTRGRLDSRRVHGRTFPVIASHLTRTEHIIARKPELTRNQGVTVRTIAATDRWVQQTALPGRRSSRTVLVVVVHHINFARLRETLTTVR